MNMELCIHTLLALAADETKIIYCVYFLLKSPNVCTNINSEIKLFVVI